MLKTLMLSAGVGALMISGAVAQQMPSAQPMPSAKQEAAKPQTSSPHFIKEQGTDHFVFSKFKGTSVLGPENANVGSVTDMLFDKNGKVMGLIVGVGGFLGIGEKNVAIAMDAFQIVPADTGTTGSAAISGDRDPTNVKLKVTWSKDQLQNAPDFAYHKPPARTTTGPGTSPTTGLGRPMTPAPLAPTAPAPR